ncbi:MAG TPA: ribosome silencing factor [Phycisphaerae bacterium]|jgi:ribosome-associated protein|nr:ribosome silencing factor [Phycisphaerae bacterium]HOB76007.1 ribosome silencing factor [Phycisphaerae bacterium]HOJ53492.1 ribosome silencing factor [Phycisphaerae bacterium]HOL25351.1 ribosome silencing factor [Phycisphaerae bacterium]HPP21855.1 ribosome silencing factor [Phycisphaerae bacterium]
MKTSAQRKAVEAGETPKPLVNGLEFAKHAARIAEEMHAEDVIILDLRGISSVADFFVIGTGTSDRQMRAIADTIEEYGRSVGQKPYGVSGYDSPSWLLLDYVDVVIHLFEPAKRQYYDLELLWGDAPRIERDEPVTA